MNIETKNKFKSDATTVFSIIVISFLIFCVTIFIKDFITFQNLTSSQYKTPWYSNNYKQPYTTIRLAMADKKNVKEYWSKNAMNSESWFIREVTVGDTIFWTTLERNKIN